MVYVAVFAIFSWFQLAYELSMLCEPNLGISQANVACFKNDPRVSRLLQPNLQITTTRARARLMYSSKFFVWVALLFSSIQGDQFHILPLFQDHGGQEWSLPD